MAFCTDIIFKLLLKMLTFSNVTKTIIEYVSKNVARVLNPVTK